MWYTLTLGKGIPRDRIQMSMAVRLQAQDIPTVDDAVRSFEGEGGVLNRLSEFGTDRIRCDHVRQARLQAFTLTFSFDNIYSETVNGRWQQLHDSWRYYYHLTTTF